jgi:subtilisin family serine protease
LREALPVSRGGADPPTQPAWNLTNLGADRVWDEFGVRGANIVVGQADSGVQWDHPELLDAYRGQAEGHDGNWLDPWSDTAAPIDYNGHGTHTLGSVLGNTVGVAPDATWFACANLQRNLGNPARYLDCLQFLFAPYPQHGDPWRDGDPTRSAHVLNNSWGCPREFEGCDPTSLLPAVRALRAAGIFVVASAGNEGPECATIADPLALYDESFTVGAVDRLGRLARFSSVGPVTVDGSNRTKPDVLAPGVRILSAFPDSTYARVDGTSMAGPHVVGVVALMWSANPSLIGDIERTEAILAETARPYMGGVADLDAFANNEETQPVDLGSTCVIQTDLDIRPNDIAGFGLVDAYAAVERALAAPGA